jgi:hypothetical protein
MTSFIAILVGRPEYQGYRDFHAVRWCIAHQCTSEYSVRVDADLVEVDEARCEEGDDEDDEIEYKT